MNVIKIPFILTLLIFVLLSSCSNEKKNLTNQYWIRYKNSKPSYVVKFKENGEFINYNKLDVKLNYQIIQGRLIISDEKGESKKYFIKQITKDVIELSRIDELGTKDIDFYRKARQQDLLLGKWHCNNPSNFLNTTFEANNKVKIEVNVNDYLAKINTEYKLIKPDTLIINKIPYKYILSDDLMKLKLIRSNKEIFLLNRDK